MTTQKERIWAFHNIQHQNHYKSSAKMNNSVNIYPQ
jgi:hypothetical protein